MKIVKFEDIIAWQKSQDFTVKLYSTYKDLKDWDFKNQICRASVSISNNIAEGFDRSSNAEFIRFLYYALGSASEVKSMLYLSERLKYIELNKQKELIDEISEISRIISGFIYALKKNS